MPAPTSLRDTAILAIRQLRDAGHEAVFAGGSVRDTLLGLDPKDYDIATSATPDEVIALFDRSIPVGVQFGVVRILLGGHEFEVATFRAEADYRDGRHPEAIRWADARADVERRDFTINGLLEDPLAPEGRAILDFVGGQADLQAGLVRAIGRAEDRFADDHLRILRAIRFAARFRFRIEEQTWQALKKHHESVTRVSPERIRDELDTLMRQGHAAEGLALAAEAHLLPSLLPEIPWLSEQQQISHRLTQLEAAPLPDDPTARDDALWASLFLATPAPAQAIHSLADRLKWSNQRRDRALEIQQTLQALPTWHTLPLSAQKRLYRQPTFPTSLSVYQADGGPLPALPSPPWSEGDLWPERLLTGRDLIQAGHRPGPHFKTALEALEDAQLEGTLPDREAAWRLIERHLRPT